MDTLPEGLPQIETVIEPESTLCPCGCGEMTRVGEDRAKRLDIMPAQFRVLVTVRPKYMCRKCEGKSHAQAPATEHLVARGLPTEGLVAHSMVAKFGDDLLFYRQSDMYRRQAVDLDRTVLANWSGRAALMLMPVIDAMTAELRQSDRLVAPSCLMNCSVPVRSWNSCPARHLCRAAAEVGPFRSWFQWAVDESAHLRLFC